MIGCGWMLVATSASMASASVSAAAMWVSVRAMLRGGGQFGRYGPAQELSLVKHPDLGQVPRVVADGDLFADVRGQRQGQVSQAVALDAVAVHLAGRGHSQQQQVQHFR